jgi:predicted ester cyclase
MLADDFEFSGPVPEPINAEAWLGMSAKMKIAFPDLDYRFKAIGSQGDIVKTTSQLSGTHRGAFDLTGMNLGVIPATQKMFSNKLEKTKVTVKNNKVTAWAVEPTAGAGLQAILKQLTVE